MNFHLQAAKSNFRKQDIYEIIIDIVKDYKNNYKMIEFEYDLKETFEMLVDKSQISRAFQNLIVNAIHSIQEKKVSTGKINLKSTIK